MFSGGEKHSGSCKLLGKGEPQYSHCRLNEVDLGSSTCLVTKAHILHGMLPVIEACYRGPRSNITRIPKHMRDHT
jgi:hypothetical protein